MKKSAPILLAFLAGLLLSSMPTLPWPPEASAMPGSTTTFTISSQADKDYILDHELVAKEFAWRAKMVSNLTAKAAAVATRRNALAVKVRRGFVANKAGLDSQLPVNLVDIAIGFTDTNSNGKRDSGENDVVRLWLDAAAVTNRASPPAGIVVGP
jgi:hypothetical protein